MKCHQERGFTLIEVLTAMGVLSIAMSALVLCLLNNMRSNMRTQIRYEAIQAAQGVLDKLRFADISGLGAATTEDVEIGDRTYEVAVSFCEQTEYCASADIKQINVDVSYKSELVYETNTVFSKLK